MTTAPGALCAALMITYLGTACFLLDIGGKRILTDPGDFDHVNRIESVPGSAGIPIMAPETVRTALQGRNVRTEPEFALGGVSVRAFPSVHGVFHDKEHRGYLLEAGGLETDIENALRNVALLRPKTVVPMHWETLWRGDAKAREFERIMRERFPAVRCIVAEHGVKTAL